MSKVQVLQLKTKLEQLYQNKIDLSDVQNEQDKENCFLTRAYCAFALQTLAEIDGETAIDSIVDTYGDNGMDGIYINDVTNELWIVQSKWIKAGTGEPDAGSIAKFISGVSDLVELKFDRFNQKVNDKSARIEKSIVDVKTKIKLVLAYTGADTIAQENYKKIQDFLDELNEASEVIDFTRFSLKNAIQSLVNMLDGQPITQDVIIKNWGKVEEPYKAIIGLVDGATLAQLWVEHRKKLLSDNIREFIGNTIVNADIKKTIIETPSHFFYYNNGITILCDDINKAPAGGSDHSMGIFHIENMKIVNGAQTVGSLGEVYNTRPNALDNVYVIVKIVALQNCPANFGVEITQKTNTQNRIEKRDFVSLDVQHQRLQTEMALFGITYQIKRSEAIVDIQKGCSVEDVITAVGCSLQNVDIAITAKREIGKLWEKVDEAPYTLIINESLSAIKAWRSVIIMRKLQQYIKDVENTKNGREKSCYIHSNRFILHLILNSIPQQYLNDQNYDFDNFMDRCDWYRIIGELETIVYQIIEEHYQSSLMHQIFRNFTKTRDIKSRVLAQIQTISYN